MKTFLVAALRTLVGVFVALIVAVVIAALLVLVFGGCMTPAPLAMKRIVVRSGPEVRFDDGRPPKRSIFIPGPLIMLEAVDAGTPADAR
jgi:hypothetical protein